MSVNGLKTIPLTGKLPAYNYPVNRTMISLGDGKLLSVVQLHGIPFESESVSSLKAAFSSVSLLLRTLAKQYGSGLGVWTHIVKKKDELVADNYQFDSAFMQDFANQYIDSFQGENFYSVKYYISFVLEGSEDEMNDLLKVALSAFKSFDCKVLAVRDDLRCEHTELLSYLINYNDEPKPLTGDKVQHVIQHSDWHFGYDAGEIRNSNNQRKQHAVYYELDALPNTHPGMCDFMLSFNGEFIMTQSMIMMRSPKALKLIDTQINLISSSDGVEHELEELESGRDYVATSEVAFGFYHASLVVLGKTQHEALKNGSDISGEFLARGTVLKRSNLKSLFTFLSVLPGSKQRIKPAPKTTTNLACTWSLHNYSIGKPTGNPVGDGTAILPLKTASNSLFYLNCHASELNKETTGEKYAGHTMILGASGTGKTTLEATLTGFFTRFNQQIFCIDYKRSTELFIRAFGGEYFDIKEGEDTGINLFQLQPTPQLISFLNRLVCRLAADEQGGVSIHDEDEIKQAIETVMAFDAPMRGLSMMLQSIQDYGLRQRLSRWCRSQDGKLAWCLDSPVNKFDPDTMDRVGFDSTLLLEKDAGGRIHEASEPILACLFFLKDLMQKEGKLLQTIVEEFWMPASFPLTQSIMQRTLKTGRLLNEFMVLSTQSPEDAIRCDIFPAIIQQTATKIYLPNPDATFESYRQCNLTPREFEKLQALDKQSRTMLIKQSNTSCFAKMDLSGFDDVLPVISGSTDDIRLCESVREDVGQNPDQWIPALLARRKQR
ncbi:VirB4 family type IV secretion/conjugal transfer ATPase [Vibrio aerogenes]|uniref:VirB4 family type IV secretion/conjugal transfer ATPase n=1 Tax=Vibrio aerogenes TaxID=92172 RepID=UPI0021C26AD7|nr:conjugal transfer protein TraE [Vibrio aerogenes]